MDFVLRRTQLASEHQYKEACRQPKATKVGLYVEWVWLDQLECQMMTAN